MSRVQKATILGLVVGFSLVACDRPTGGQPAERVRELDQIPVAQLRVMLKGYPGDWRAAGDRNTQSPEPPSEKPVPPGSKLITLPDPRQSSLGTMSVREALAGRKSSRQFSQEQISEEELSYLLWAAQGITDAEKDNESRTLRHSRTAPSAGARYPLETYLAANRVAGLARGLYRYVPSSHQLLLIQEDSQFGEKISEGCYGSAIARDAAVVLVWSATPYRTEWKYAYLAHRMIAMEAGHVCENIYLAATSCRLGACALLGYHQPTLDALLGLDGTDEFTIYLACIGRPATASQ